ncbi:aspartate-alanine antiporter [Uliginosibacterium sp. H3]|uniref:Aspartate-alanine antiporter n=1 Tax=Uliginosibacterium silvisoli TaxID=3114758 RepID=A0ABU6K4F8_9RHOO|nr:aspartate-alanine antiporter [Uliginosibacterium sp. H3]
MWVVNFLRQYPELAIFLTLGVGYWVGSIKIGSFSLGSVTGTLLVGVLIGQFHIDISANVKSVFFLMFLFALGYGVGPQFFRGLKSDGLPQVWFAVIICVLCLIVTWACAKVAGFDAGTAAGLLSGAQTISAVMGVAQDTINGLSLTPEQKKAMSDHIPVAYAVTYIFGTAGTAWILATLGPKLLGVDLAAACKEYEAQMAGGEDSSGLTGYRMITVRAYAIQDSLVNKRVADLEASFPGYRVFVERIRRAGKIVEPDPTTTLLQGDVIALAGRHEVLVGASASVGAEVEDRELLSVPAEALEVVLTDKSIAGKTLGELVAAGTASGSAFARGVFLRKVERAGQSLPINAGLKLDRGDHLFIVGAKHDVERVAKQIGYPDRVNDQTDMILVGLGIVIGGLIGAQSIKVGGVPISLSTSGGALIMGLVAGYLRSTDPRFGRISSGAQWFMSSVGLTTFIAVVGISSGPGFVAGLQALGLKLFVAGVVATSLPMIAGLYIGHYLFKFHPAINLGVNAGARVTTAALGQLTDAAKSNVPALGYTVPYAISNTLLIVWGIVIVVIM